MSDCGNAILRLNSHDSADIKQAAFDVADMSCADAIPLLLSLLETTDLEAMGAIAYALGELRAEEAKPKLINLLNDPKTKGMKGSLVYAMMYLNCKDYYREILGLLNDDYYEVRQKAVIIIDDVMHLQPCNDLMSMRSGLIKKLKNLGETDEKRHHIEDVLEIISIEINRRCMGPSIGDERGRS